VPRYGRVALGGTFDRFHVGHEALLASAFRLGRTVGIGVTTPRYLAEHPKPGGETIAPEPVRRRALERWLRQRYPARRWTLIPLNDRFGGSVDNEVDALVVSVDTAAGGRAVNRERRRLGRRPIPLHIVPLVLADDLEPVSSRRIRAGEIDRWGRRRSPIRVHLAVGSTADSDAAARAIRRAFPRARVVLGSARPRREASPLPGPAHHLELRVSLRRVRPEGWRVTLRGPHVALGPWPIHGVGPRALQAGLARLLRPPRPKPI